MINKYLVNEGLIGAKIEEVAPRVTRKGGPRHAYTAPAGRLHRLAQAAAAEAAAAAETGQELTEQTKGEEAAAAEKGQEWSGVTAAAAEEEEESNGESPGEANMDPAVQGLRRRQDLVEFVN